MSRFNISTLFGGSLAVLPPVGFFGLLYANGSMTLPVLLGSAAVSLPAIWVLSRSGQQAIDPPAEPVADISGTGFLRDALDHVQDEIYIYHCDTLRIVYMNNTARETCAWTPEEMADKRITDTDPNFTESGFRDHVAPLMAGEAKSVSIEAKHAKGYVEIVTTRYSQTMGNGLFISVLRDIDARRRMDQAKISSVSTVSHELRTPLTSIKGALDLLRSAVGAGLSDSQLGLIDMASRNSDRLLFTVNDILDLEKVQAGRMKFERAIHDLGDILAEAVQVNTGFGLKHKVRLTLESDVSDAFVYADRNRLIQVLSNLMSNAIKFSDESGSVNLSLSEIDNAWVVSVSDKGPGIHRSQLDKIFEPFSQSTAIDGKKRMGTGLGLAISQRIIENLGGSIHVESTVGQGSTFHVHLPKVQENRRSLSA